MATENVSKTPVVGYLAKNWTGVNTQNPAVIVNPQAGPLDLLAWCWAELLSLQSAADVLEASNDDIDKGDFSTLVVYRIAPLANVLEQALNRLHSEATQAGKQH